MPFRSGRDVRFTLSVEGDVGLFDRKNKPEKADFSNVRSGVSTRPDAARQAEGSDQRQATTYKVKSGDTLSAIAQREYGDANQWRRIYEANRDRIDDPDMIHPGQELEIPGGERGVR